MLKLNSKYTKPAIILFFSFLVIIAIFFKFNSDISTLKETYRQEKTADLKLVSNLLEEKLNYVYQTIRTMSFVPGVRKIDRYAEHFEVDAKATVQQLFNNAFLNIKLSEIYLLPQSLDPDKIDPKTKKGEEPITTFDEFIASGFAEPKKDEAPPKLAEVEEYEYKLMKTQLEYLSKNFPTSNSFKDLEVPLVSGPEVITCDNAEFSEELLKDNKNSSRMGIVFTVPMYDMTGKFKGGVSAVLRSNVIRSFLASADYTLVNQANSFSANLEPSKALSDSMNFLAKQDSNPDLIFSGKSKIKLPDNTSWEVWTASDDEAFWSDTRYLQIKKELYFSIAMTLIIAAFLIFSALKDFKLTSQITSHAKQLSQKSDVLAESADSLAVTTSILTDAVGNQSSAAQTAASSMHEIEAMVNKTSELAEKMDDIAQDGLVDCDKGLSALDKVLEAVNEVKQKQNGLQSQIDRNKHDLSRVIEFISEITSKTKVINEIVFQTKLLSFNASVEAARAGEHGKGFSVVAEEVGNLAKMSGNSAEEIVKTLDQGTIEVKEIIKTNSEVFDSITKEVSFSVEKAVSLSNECKKIFQSIQGNVVSMTEMNNQIALASKEQNLGVAESNRAAQVISESTQNSSAQTNDLKEVASVLSAQATEISDLVASLKGLVVTTNEEAQMHNQANHHLEAEENHDEAA